MSGSAIRVDNPICVALDSSDPARLRALAAATAPSVGMFKIGLTAFGALGPPIVRELAAHKPVFLDLKLHDIPAQVEGAVRALSDTGASFVTVHAAGGRAMLEAAAAAAADDVTVLAVTILTSLDDAAVEEVGMRGPASDAVSRLAALALDAGVDGLVCSPLEVGELRARFGTRDEGGPLLVVPGIRPPGAGAGDQRRTLEPSAALAAGADVIVIGRPITGADDPAEAARRIRERSL